MPNTEARFIGSGKDLILKGHNKLLWPYARRIGMRLPGAVLFWERCIEHIHCFTYNTDKIPLEVVPISTIYVKDPHMQVKRKKLGVQPQI